MSDRYYCTLAELLTDLGLPGIRDEEAAVSRIRAASDWIDRHLGQFIPVTETRSFDGKGTLNLWIDALLAITTVTDDGTALGASDYVPYPLMKHWPNGPYSRLTIDPDSARSVWTDEEDVIEIAGRWGLYEEAIATGATVQSNPLAAGGTSLVVSNGAKAGVGMVLKIESEQLLVTASEAPTDTTANLAEDLDNSEEEWDLSSAASINVGEILRVDFEQAKVLDKVSNTVAVKRGWNETKIVAHTTAADVYAYRTFTVKRGCNGTTDAAHVQGTAISRYIPPFDVNWLCRQIAGLMLKKAQSGFAGKVGNAELGEVFYTNEFPKDVIDRIRRNYSIPSL